MCSSTLAHRCALQPESKRELLPGSYSPLLEPITWQPDFSPILEGGRLSTDRPLSFKLLYMYPWWVSWRVTETWDIGGWGGRGLRTDSLTLEDTAFKAQGFGNWVKNSFLSSLPWRFWNHCPCHSAGLWGWHLKSLGLETGVRKSFPAPVAVILLQGGI